MIPRGESAEWPDALHHRRNQILIEHLDPAAWRAKPPGKAGAIAAIFTHMHNVRAKWVRLSSPRLKVPPQLNRAHRTRGRPVRDWLRAPLAARR